MSYVYQVCATGVDSSTVTGFGVPLSDFPGTPVAEVGDVVVGTILLTAVGSFVVGQDVREHFLANVTGLQNPLTSPSAPSPTMIQGAGVNLLGGKILFTLQRG